MFNHKLIGIDGTTQMFQRMRIEKLEGEVRALSEQLAKLLAGPVEERLLTSKELAGFVGVTHHKTVEKWARDREKGMPCIRDGRLLRFRLGDVLRWRAQRMGG